MTARFSYNNVSIFYAQMLFLLSLYLHFLRFSCSTDVRGLTKTTTDVASAFFLFAEQQYKRVNAYEASSVQGSMPTVTYMTIYTPAV